MATFNQDGQRVGTQINVGLPGLREEEAALISREIAMGRRCGRCEHLVLLHRYAGGHDACDLCHCEI